MHWNLFEIGPFLFLMYNCTWSWFCAYSLALCVTCVYKISAALHARSHFIWFYFFSNLFFSNRYLPEGLQKANNTECDKAQIISNSFFDIEITQMACTATRSVTLWDILGQEIPIVNMHLRNLEQLWTKKEGPTWNYVAKELALATKSIENWLSSSYLFTHV